MQAPSATEALAVWERGAGHGAAERGLALLGLAYTGAAREALADLPLGTRDGALLDLREAMFGPRMESCANCPACGEMMEMGFSTRDLHAPPPDDTALTLEADGYALRLRRLTTRDLLSLERGDVESARRDLVSRCLVSSANGGSVLPAPVVDAAAEALSRSDPQADIQLSITCASCGHAWRAPFDILSYLWTELDSWAQRILREVHVLARAYGWHESDILALSPARRRAYLEMVAS
ncbi:MAG TPA: hypothetical protein VGG48_09160 [Rhizomicrobium sp.]|jgi:hypothetical protein